MRTVSDLKGGLVAAGNIHTAEAAANILESGGNFTPVQEGWAPPETVVRNLVALLESV